MKKIGSLVAFLLVFFIASSSSAAWKSLKTKPVKASDITGTYTLILYGGRYADDLESLAILDREDDKFAFEIFAPAFDYKVKKGLPAKEAIELAEKHVNWHHSFWRLELSSILDNEGNVLGYEFKPLYLPVDIGSAEAFDVYYTIKGDKIVTRVRLRPDLERKKIFNDDDTTLLFRHK